MLGMRRSKSILIVLGVVLGLFVLATLLLEVHYFKYSLGNIMHPISDNGTKDIMHLKSVRNGSITHQDVHAFPTDKRLFQSTFEQEFPSVPGNQFIIPHIIHHIYTDDNVPQVIAPMIESCVRNNPTWKYMFWTHATGRTLINRTHPYLLNAYNGFTSNNGVSKNDLLRWVVLYEYGGLYADMDVECLRPLDIATKRYACILPVEPFEHAAINNMQYLLSNAVVLCRPKHPFVKFVLMHMGNARDGGNPVGATGPGFITGMFKAYNKIQAQDNYSLKTDMSSNSPSFYKGVLNDNDTDAVYVPNSQYFMDTVSAAMVKSMEQTCYDNKNPLTDLKKRACFEFISRQEVRRNQKFTFTVHHWFHLWAYRSDTVQTLDTVPIRYIVPDRIIYR